MKKAFLIGLLSIILVTFTGCGGDTSSERDWREDFTVTYRHIEESQFDTIDEELDALLNHTYVWEQDEYTITNKTNYVFKGVTLVFHADFIGYEPYDFEKYVGMLKQGESEIVSLNETLIALGANITSFPDSVIFDFDKVTLLRIDYKIAD